MKITINKLRLKRIGFFLSSVCALILYIAGLSVTTDDVKGLNISNQTVLARVNISNVAPSLFNVTIKEPLDGDGNIDLSAGSNVTVICNGTFRDGNGYDDIVSVNGTLYFDNGDYGAQSPADNNTVYVNSSCDVNACEEVPTSGSENGSCTCQFAVHYHANFGNWRCNMTIVDSGDIISDNASGQTFMNEVIGISLNNLTLDYGDLTVTQTSAVIPKNITNVGNVPLNVSVFGYGGENQSEGMNWTMTCASGANISFGNHRFSLYDATPFDVMTNLTNQSLPVANLTIPKKSINEGLGNSTNVTYWRLRIPTGPSGVCNGTVVFGAVDGRGNP